MSAIIVAIVALPVIALAALVWLFPRFMGSGLGNGPKRRKRKK